MGVLTPSEQEQWEVRGGGLGESQWWTVKWRRREAGSLFGAAVCGLVVGSALGDSV